MSIQLKICRDFWGTWSVHGLSPMPQSHLPSLPASIEYARKACYAAPATIELYVDGVYIVAHQERGWPKALVAPDIGRSRAVSAGLDLGTMALWSRLAAWLRRSRPLNTQLSPASVQVPKASKVARLNLV